MVDWLVSQGVRESSILDVGGGVGEIGLELLHNGAAHATTVELSRSYDEPATALAVEAGLADRVTRRIGDIAADGTVADAVDVVVLHRVVCCYPDAEQLLAAAADHARQRVVLSHPRRNTFTRALLAVENLGQRLIGSDYRAFVHPPAEMAQVLRDHGFRTEHVYRGPIWQVHAASRAEGRMGGTDGPCSLTVEQTQ